MSNHHLLIPNHIVLSLKMLMLEHQILQVSLGDAKLPEARCGEEME